MSKLPQYLSLLIAVSGCSDLNLSSQEPAETERALSGLSHAYKPPECSPAVDAAIRAAVAKYKLPRWFYYAVVHRESTFNPLLATADGGQGLTQLTGSWYNGTVYPEGLATPNQANAQWRADMRIQDFCAWICPWIDMNQVTPLQPQEWQNPAKNLDRYTSGYALPMYKLLRLRYPSEPVVTTLRRVAFHWRYGVYNDNYPSDPAAYFPGQYGYDQYVASYRPAVEAEDGVWTGLSASVTTYEAEAMTHSVGGPSSGGWNLWSNGYIATQHPFTAGVTTLTVTARGEQAANVWPHLVVSVGGVLIGGATAAATTWTSYTFTFTATAGSQEIRVAFDNDYYDTNTGADRNLILDKVTVGAGNALPSSIPANPIAFSKNTVFTVNSGYTNWVYVPTAYDNTHNTPTTLFVWLHGCGGQSSGDIWNISGSSTKWISLTVGGREGSCWNVTNDSGLVLAAIAKIKTHFNVHPKRVFVGGYSSGGELAYRSAFFNASQFAGVLVENTAPFTTVSVATAISNASWKFNILHLAHLQDNTFGIAGVRSDTDALAAAGFPTTRIERPGNHWDNPGALPGTVADLKTYLLSHLSDGWQAP